MISPLDLAASISLITTSSISCTNPGYRSRFKVLYDKHADYGTLVVEATVALYWQFRSATSNASLFAAICSYYHAISGSSVTGTSLRVIHNLVNEIKTYVPWHQSGSSWIDVLDQLYSNTKRVVKSALGEKIVKVFNHVVALAMYKKAGIELDPVLFGELEKKRIRPTVWDVASFADAIAGLVLFLCKAGRQALATGNVDCFFIDDGVLNEWVEKASRLRKDYEFTGNPSAVGMALPSYINEVKECIATGKQLQKHFRKGREANLLMNILLELECVLKRLDLSLMASSFRRAPIGVFLYGGAGVAKSHIALGLFNHYCAIRGISKECATMWTRTENDEYYSGYKSHYAGVLYDDAAKYRVGKMQGIDPSIGDIISAINNIQFVTPQAELQDKGRIPFRSEWVGVTSNVEDLNTSYYFNCTAAFLRRFAVRIIPKVKPEFCLPGEERIDPSKIPAKEQYPDLWTFQVDVPVVNKDEAKFVTVHEFEHYSELLEYMTGVYEKHIAKETKLMESVSAIGPEKVCDCKLPVSLCRCVVNEDGTRGLASEDGTMLFGTCDIVAQSGAACTEQHWDRVNELQRHKHVTYLTYGKDKVMLAFLKQTYDDPLVSRWFNPAFCDPGLDRTEEHIINELCAHIDRCVEEFLTVEPRDRLNHLTDGAFSAIDDTPDLSYLSFEPKFGRRGFFIQSQISALRDQILKYVPMFSAKEVALLDVYLEEEAPRHIAAGWSISSIIRGGHDYVKHYSKALEDPDRVEAREFLLGTRDSKWYERLGVWFAGQYFEKPWVYSTVNYVTQFRICRYIAAQCINRSAHPRAALMMEGARIDRQRQGGNAILIALVSVIGVISVAALMVQLYSVFKPQPRETALPVEQPRVEPVIDPDQQETEDSPEDVAVAQMDLESVGKRPVVRPGDKENVWVVKERAITRLDVDPKRPHNGSQLMNAIKNNLVFCRVYSTFNGRQGYANTRALVIDDETLLINNHALPVGSKIEVWLGPVKDEGVRPSYCIDVSDELVTRHPARDVAIVKTWSNPCRFKDIKHLFPRKTFCSVGPAEYLVRQKDHSIESVEVIGATLSGLQGLAGAEDVVCEAWKCHPMRQTVQGECGSPLVVHSSLGAVVVGIHSGYDVCTNTAWAVRVFREDFDEVAHPEVGYIRPSGPLAQVGQFLKLKPTDKLYTDYHKDGHIMTHGQLKGFIARPKFTGTYTPHAFYCFKRGDEFNPPIEDNMAAPRNAGWKQPQMVLENYLHPTHSMNEMIVRACVQAYQERISTLLDATDLEDVHPVPLSVAVNGMPGVPNVDAQKHATSAGHGKRGPKLQYLSEPVQYDVWDSYREFDAQTLAEIDEMRERMYRGERPHAIYDACWKNEMLSKTKVEAGKARCIYMCPLAFLVNMRMSTVAMCRVMIRRRDVFCIAVGLNTHSEEWDDVYKAALRIPGDNWIAGDFKAFESCLGLLISKAVSKVIEHVARMSGNYTPEELMALRVELADISNATINFFGELITLLGGEASGQQLTTFFNCIANVLLHMYAYVVVYAKEGDYSEHLALAREFFAMVFCNTLGDDVYLKVHPDRMEYNHTSIQGVFASIGITYTMAEKDAASRPFIPLGEVTFLKRKFVDHEAFPGMKVAALDKKSIYKMLCYTVPSHSVSAEEQMAAAIASAQAEAFFHGLGFFVQIQDLIAEMPKSRELEFRMTQVPPPSWNAMVARFVRASPKLQVRQISPVLEEKAGTGGSYCHASALELQAEWRVDPWGSTVMERSSDVRVHGRARLCAEKVPRSVLFETAHASEEESFSKNINKVNKNSPTTADREMAPKVVAQAISKVRRQKRTRERREKWNGVAQADIQYDTLSVPSPTTGDITDVVQQQVVFKNEPTAETLVAPSSKDEISAAMRIQQDIGNYLRRPQLIFSYAWAENTTNGAKTDFSPWQLFFQNLNMQNKLSGYHLLRCKLVLKYLINGSPFYYGSMMATYTPLNGYRLDTAEATGVEMRLTASSQKPHVWLENQNCSTVEMELPFLYPYPFLDVGRLSDFTNMGTVHLVQYAPLLSANGTSSTNVDIQVYAWAEDVELSGPTNMPVMQSEILPVAQSEFKPNGQISGPASTVAAVAGKLANAPYIGPYAKATSMVAGAIGDVASFFGFTNVPNVRDIEAMKQVPFSLASTSISEPVQKLSLQPKQETAIGSEQHGGDGNDELVISRFCSRSAYICGPAWNTTDAPNTVLFTTSVTPQMFTRSTTEIAHSPMSYVANHFQYWRGSIKYTFKVVRSPYHRGRLQISWDAGSTNLGANPPLGNANTLTTIMDLDEDSECSFVVPYMQRELFTKTYAISDTGTQVWSTNATPGGTWDRGNGVLSVRVLNRLTAPEASSSATILVFASACDDIEFAGPRDFIVYSSGNNILSLNAQTVATAQSDIQYTDEAHATELMPRGANHRVYDQVFGERIGSLREYMHRSSLSFLWYPGATTTDVGSGAVRIPIKRIPPPPGVFNNGWWLGTTSSGAGQTVFYTKMHPILSFSTCFIGYKGSVNVNVNLDQPVSTTAVDTLSIQRISNGDSLSAAARRPSLYTYSNPAASLAVNARADIIATDAGRAGMALTNTKTNAGLSAQLPYYSQSGFQMCDPRREYSNQDNFTDRNNDWWRIEWRYNKNNSATSTSGALTSVYYATGPDFDLVYFINVPVMTLVSVSAV